MNAAMLGPNADTIPSTAEVRRPHTIEKMLNDVLDSLVDPNIAVVVTKQAMVDILQILVKLKHS